MDKKSFYKKTIRILKYAKPYWKTVTFLFVLAIILSLIALVNPYLLKILIDDIFISKNYPLLVSLMLFFIFVFFFKTGTEIYYSYKTTRLAENMVLDVKQALFEHLERLDLGFFYTKQLGDILVRVDEDVYSIEDYVSIMIDDILMNVMTGIFILVVCLMINWRVTLICLGFFPFYILAQKYFGKKIKEKKQHLIEKSADMLSFLQETFSSIKLIKTFLLEKFSLDRYLRKSRHLIKTNLKLTLLEGYANGVVGLITFTPLLLILWYGGVQVIEGALTVGSLIALYTYIGQLFGPIASLGSVNIAIQSTLVSVERVFDFLDKKPKVQESPNAMALENVKGELCFNHVSFGYNKHDTVLNDVSFKMKPGEQIGLIGPSGAGKSTIANLVARFYDPKDGEITLDGVDLTELKLDYLRKIVGIVSQETILLNATIKENIKLGNLHAKDVDVVKSAKLANIHDYIKRLPKGYDTIVGERGANLSGGEKQRISIARTILKDPKIVILDEATSSLDSKSELKIQQALERVTKGKTTLIIAHRLSTIKNVDQIMVVVNHGIAEKGSFKELMKKKGAFYEFYTAQFGRNK